MAQYLYNLIQQGEHQQLEFKFEISDSKKIARTLVAFANTDGGRILIGVKDNGKIAGVKGDEEFYMLEAAANMYCKPVLPFQIVPWDLEGKTVLEVLIARSPSKPHRAPAPDNKWMVYIRAGGQNLLADPVLLKLWDREQRTRGTFIHYSVKEKILLDYLKNTGSVTLDVVKSIAGISKHQAEILLVNLLAVGVISMKMTEKETSYYLRTTDK